MDTSAIDIPQAVIDKWQEITNLLAELVQVPAALIMRAEPPEISVFVASKSQGNPYHSRERACLDTGLYCETVMRTRQLLLVPDALDDDEWRSNPDIELGMISYLGVPISWPNGDIFGTICVLDHKRNTYRELHHRLLLQLRDAVQADLLSVSLYEARLADEKRLKERLEAQVTERTTELANINDALLLEVAEHKRAAAALRESEQRFRDYAETASDWLWETGTDHRFIQASEQPATIGAGPALRIGAARWDFATDLEEEPEKWRRHVATLEAHEPFHNFGYRTTRGDGAVLHIAISGKPVFDPEGQFLGYRGVASDVTAAVRAEQLLASQAAISLENARLYTDLLQENRERQTVENAMQVSEARWHSLFENVAVGIALVGSGGRFVEVNPSFCAMTGYSAAELCHLTPGDITHEDDRAATAGILATQATDVSSALHIEKRYRRKDGGIIWGATCVVMLPVIGGEQLLAAAVVTDITERKRAEAALAQAQEISRTGSWRWNVVTGEVAWSAEHFHIFGFTPMAMQPSYTLFLARVHPEDRPALEQILDQAVRARSRFQHDYRISLPDGSIKYLQSVGQPDNTALDRLEFVGTVMDITERKRAEEALRNAQAELARVTRLTTLGELAASLAHEINQPLAALATSGNACLRWLNRDPPDIAAAQQAVARIVQDAHRAGDVIRGLRALAQKSGPQLTRLNLNDTIGEVLALTRGEMQRYDVMLHTDLSADDRPVLGDRVQLQQVLLNLIMNAIQAMEATIDRRRELTVSIALADPTHVQVVVEDSGSGLDPAVAPRIFDPLFTTKPDGLGMGLSICRSIIETHGGQLWASPRGPHGTAFHFTIPIAVERSGTAAT